MKAIITDLDRTLLRTDKTISEYTEKVFWECHNRGVLVMAATARPERSVMEYIKTIKFDAMTTLNGARVVLPDRAIDNGIPRETVETILSRLCDVEGAVISIEASDGLYANVDIPEWRPIVVDCYPQAPTNSTIYKILVSSESVDLQEIMPTVITEDTYYSVANGTLFQIMSSKATKWNGVLNMLAEYGIDKEEVIYFGDDYDDIESIRNCGVGIAMANSISAVLEVADVVIGKNDEDAVAKYVEEMLTK